VRVVLLALLAAAAAVPSSAQSAGDLPLTGRWLAFEVRGDSAATADLARGRLEKVLVVHPGGRALLRGRDHAQDAGRPKQFIGRVEDGALVLDDLPGEARLHVEGRRLVVTDPRGTETVYLRWPLDELDWAQRLMR